MFTAIYESYSFKDVQTQIQAITNREIERALMCNNRNLNDFQALVSPAALPYLNDMAALSQASTLKKFGKTVQLFAPLYLSNACNNICTYCGFSLDNKIPRRTLSLAEIEIEARAIQKLQIQNVLLVTGESQHQVGMPYFIDAVTVLKKYFSQIAMEVQPLDISDYQQLHDLGVHAVLVYQETYNKADYALYHLKGRKSNFNYRLETPDRIAQAHIHKIGLGALLGLSDWRTDSFFTALHLNYLEKKYWQTKFSISFPRLRPHETIHDQNKPIIMTEKELAQLICAYRLCFENVDLSISTRERPQFRNNIFTLGVTTMSAGSKTNPGGYTLTNDSLEQFEIDDNRSPQEFAQAIAQQGYDPVWKDWDAILHNH
ncbi:MAG: 2-iminoacetate synthase ThiH [Phycisphaerales bacterium]|nr:2-iminoacetate synthase ThiH [Phycisphaerales bacterium]